jgi:hypothetical protein
LQLPCTSDGQCQPRCTGGRIGVCDHGECSCMVPPFLEGRKELDGPCKSDSQCQPGCPGGKHGVCEHGRCWCYTPPSSKWIL